MIVQKSGSYSYKTNGEVSSPCKGQSVPLGYIQRVEEIRGLSSNTFIQKSTQRIFDPRLSKTDQLVGDVVESLAFLFGKCQEPLRVIAVLANASERQTKDSVKVLVSTGYVRRERSKRRGYPDTLIPVKRKTVQTVERMDRCVACGVSRPINRLGVCAPCRQYRDGIASVKQIFERRGQCEWAVAYAILKAEGVKGSRQTLHRAYLASLEEFGAEKTA